MKGGLKEGEKKRGNRGGRPQQATTPCTHTPTHAPPDLVLVELERRELRAPPQGPGEAFRARVADLVLLQQQGLKCREPRGWLMGGRCAKTTAA